jgi:hypothetical protein
MESLKRALEEETSAEASGEAGGNNAVALASSKNKWAKFSVRVGSTTNFCRNPPPQ